MPDRGNLANIIHTGLTATGVITDTAGIVATRGIMPDWAIPRTASTR